MVRLRSLASLLTSLVLFGMFATSTGAAPRGPEEKRCFQEAVQAGLIGAGLNPSTIHYILGTGLDDAFAPTRLTEGPDLICGFEGNDTFTSLYAGDVFLGGEGNDGVTTLEGGTFNGSAGVDRITGLLAGTFNGGNGDDHVISMTGGTFNGGDGSDGVLLQTGGTFNQD